MKTKNSMIRKLIALFAISCLSMNTIFAQLSGIYTIGSTGDYTTFTEAVDTLISQGVSGPVVFNVQDGSYLEQFVIPAITGASAAFTITFQSLSQDSTAVTLFYGSSSSGDNYVVKLNGANFINFHQLTIANTGTSFSYVFYFLGGASNDTISNCVLTGPNTTFTSTNLSVIYGYGSQDQNNVIQNNLIVNGSYGIHLRGTSTSILSAGNEIINNQFVNNYYYGVMLRNQNAPKIINNNINMSNSYSLGYGIYAAFSDNNMEIQKNKINMTNGGYGITLSSSDGSFILKGSVANNFIYIGGGGTAYGIYCITSIEQNIFHNSVNVLGSSNSGRAFYAFNGSILDVRNNCFKNSGWGYTYYTNSLSNIATSDYNNYYGSGNFLAYWGGDVEDLIALKVVNGKDVNSISVKPVYTSNTDLHTTIFTLDGKADPTAGITTDIDGDARAGTPDIGADEFVGVGAPLAGIYTVGGVTPDFVTVSAAVDSLNDVGISASVTFNIRDGSYSEQFQVYPVTGADAAKTVTFQSENRDSSLVDINFNASSTNRYVFRLRSADYITIRDLSISANGVNNSIAIRISGNAKFDSIHNCVINSNTNVSSLGALHSGSLFNNIVVQNNLFNSGYWGVFLNADNSILATGIDVSNNIFSGQTYISIYLEDQDASIITNNNITTTGLSSYNGIYLNDVENDFVLTGNTITSSNGSDGGIEVEYCTGTNSKKGLIANNFVNIGGSTTAYGIYTRLSDFVNIYYNSVQITSTYNILSGNIAYNNNSGSNLDVRNNIFTNFGGSYAYYANNGTAITTSDHNDLFTSGNFVGYWNGVAKNDLAAFQAANSMDVNSVSVNPVFVSSTDLHATSSFVDSAGTPLPSITVDIDGDARDAINPDIGADEFDVDSTMTPLIGVYTIGGTSPDYATFTLAVSDLNLRGIAGVVTFNARPGTYGEQVVVLPISGSNSADTVVFQSETGDSTSVIMAYGASTAGDNYVFRFYGASHVSIKNMTLAATGGAYAKVIHINGNVEDINLLNNILSSSNTANSVSSVIDAYNDVISDIVIRNNFISEGYIGVNINGDDGIDATGVVIENNIITSSSSVGIRLEDCDAPKVIENDVSNSGNNYYGIYLLDCDNALQVIKNRVVSSDYYYGIYLRDCNGSNPFQGLIANNFSIVGGAGVVYGIRIYNCYYMNVYHNSVSITSTSISGRAFYISNGGSNINVNNNIFSNTGAGHAYYVASTSIGAFTSSDNNDLYATGANLAYWAANQENLDSLQGASGMDVNSLSVIPQFYSNTDLHIGQVLLMGAATPLAVVTDDIDGHPRDPSTPDIGADEFFCQPPTFNVSVTEPCLGDSTIFTDLTSNVEPGSTFEWDFTNDGFVDYTSFTPNETIKHLYTAAGTYTVRLVISQIAGCVDTLTFAAMVNTFPIVNFVTTGVYCDSANGEATANVSGGAAPYTYLWSTGGSTQTITGLNLGVYTVTVNDANSCAVIDTVSISESMSVTVVEISGSTCGNADGIAAVTSVSGGFPPYNYVWSNGDTTNTDSTLTSGVQYVTVIDINGCVAFGTVAISDSGNAPNVGIISLTNNNCSGEEIGSLDINVAQGTSPYTYLWSNGSTTQDIDSLSGGIYEVIVTDAAGCVTTESYTIITPDLLTVSVVSTDAGCNLSDGIAFVVVSGGTTPYTYSWSSGGTNSVETGLTAGIYTVTVTDNNSCSTTEPVLINNVGGPIITNILTTDVDCNNPSNGAIDISVSGGTPSYTYDWSTTDTLQDINNLPIGTYNVTVTDANGCIAAASIDINDIIPAVQPICIVTVDSATGTNLIIWEKTVGFNIAYYNIYREGTQSGIYFLVGSRPYDSLSTFLDTFANPQQRSWRYKISAVDSCGQESELSTIHKTMHLAVNLGQNNTINLIWDGYQGFTYLTYIIYRGPSLDSLQIYDFVVSADHMYNDLTPLSDPSYYYVAVTPPSVCTATKKVADYNSSRSNTSTSISGGSVAPAADFTANTTSIAVGGNVTFTDLSLNGPTSWAWTFTGGTPSSDTLQNPANIVYNTPGSYDVTLIATNINGSDTLTKLLYITVTSTGSAPVAAFLGCTTINIGGSIGFLDQSQNSPISWTWIFENGNPPFSTVQNPTNIVYNASGNFDVTLIVTNANGSDTLIMIDCITVNPVGINENTLEEAMKVYPNPSNGVINLILDLTKREDVTINVFNMQGQLIYSKHKGRISGTLNEQIDLSDSRGGIYHLQVIADNGVVNRKVVIE